MEKEKNISSQNFAQKRKCITFANDFADDAKSDP
jgi:hypothetical protein